MTGLLLQSCGLSKLCWHSRSNSRVAKFFPKQQNSVAVIKAQYLGEYWEFDNISMFLQFYSISDVRYVCSSRSCNATVQIRLPEFTSVFANENLAAHDPQHPPGMNIRIWKRVYSDARTGRPGLCSV